MEYSSQGLVIEDMPIERISVNGGNVQGARFQNLPTDEGFGLSSGRGDIAFKAEVGGVEMQLSSWFHSGSNTSWAVLQFDVVFQNASGTVEGLILSLADPSGLFTNVLNNIKSVFLGSSFEVAPNTPLKSLRDDFDPGGAHPKALIVPVNAQRRRTRDASFLQYSLSKNIGQSYQTNYLFTSICAKADGPINTAGALIRAAMSPFGL